MNHPIFKGNIPDEISRVLKLGGFNYSEESKKETEGNNFYTNVSNVAVGTIQTFGSAAKQVKSVYEQARGRFGAASEILVYLAVFIVAFVFFFVLLNFSSVISQVSGFISTQSQDQAVLGDRLPAYNNWIKGYYFAISDRNLVGPHQDIDRDGLSNMDEFIIKTSPTVADSDSDGVSDGIEIMNQANPWGKGGLTKNQKNLLADMDIISINNRISFNAFGNKNPVATPAEFDLNKNGRLSIPKLGLQVPIVFSKDPSDFERDLERGVIHYPGTALPGQDGTIYISGHSSDYFWKKHPYRQVFAKLNFLEPGDDVFVDMFDKEGKLRTYRYKVNGEKVYSPDDQTQFIDNSGPKLHLSTCWPIGTQKDRLVVSATLEK